MFKFSHLMLVAAMMTTLAGCSGMHLAAYPISEKDILVERELYIGHLFSHVSTSWLERCKKQVTVPYTWEEARWHWDRVYIDYQECERLTPFQSH